MALTREPNWPLFSGRVNNWRTAAEARSDGARRWDFLGELPRNHTDGPYLFVHGSARNPLNEYVFPEDIYNRRKMEKIFALSNVMPSRATRTCRASSPKIAVSSVRTKSITSIGLAMRKR